LESKRQGHQPIDDGIYPALARGRVAGEGMVGNAVVPVALEGIRQPLFLGSLHADWPVELKVMVLARATVQQLPEPLVSARVIA